MKTCKYLLVIALITGPARLPALSFSHEGSGDLEIISKPSPQAFSVCYGHTCHNIETLSISREEWERATAPLEEPAESAAKERQAIAASIAIMEDIVGRKTGTYRDLGRNLRGMGESGQMDCIDESTNTNTYLYMLEQAGYLRWHRLLPRSTRFGFRAGMPHTTAVIEDICSSRRYAVDSWFFDNGKPPAIVELSAWERGWDPDDAQQ